MHPLKIFQEDNFKEMITEIGPWNYHIYDKGESLPGKLLKRDLDITKYNCVVAGTGCTIANYSILCHNQPEIIIPKGEPVMVLRLLRYDDRHGEPHYNANDQIIFPTISTASHSTKKFAFLGPFENFLPLHGRRYSPLRTRVVSGIH